MTRTTPRHAAVALALALVLAPALGACTRYDGVSDGIVITCSGAADCPGGRVCNRGRCVDPSAIDTTPPDLASTVVVSPGRVKAGEAFTATFDATEPLDAPPSVSLGLAPPALLSCAALSSVRYACTYTATGAENAGRGGTLSLDVRMIDRSGNDTSRSGVASVTFDFAPPAPTVASVVYEPAARNPLASVARATQGTRVRVIVSADERLSATPPVLAGSQGATVLPFELAPGGLGEHDATFVATVPPLEPDGVYTLAITWADDLGNAGTARVPATVEVKTSTPTLVVDQGALVFVRAPQGNAAAEHLGDYTIPAGPYFAVDPSDTLTTAATLPSGALRLADGGRLAKVIVQAPSSVDPVVLGFIVPDDAGRLARQRLLCPDVVGAQLVGVDDAGNLSPPVKLRNVEWVASSNRPVGVSAHRVATLSSASGARALTASAVVATGAEDAGADGTALLAQARIGWTPRDTTGNLSPPGRDASAMAYDAARGRVVMFGGYSNNQDRSLDDTWEWDGSAWHDLTTVGAGPTARSGHAMAYDAARGRVVLFGGPDAVTWEWDGASWHDVSPLGQSPAAGTGYTLTFDAARGVSVLLGGTRTWEWDGASWRDVTPAGACPSARSGHAAAYDSDRRRTVIFGGSGLRDTWEWDGVTWTSITPAGMIPPACSTCAMAYDQAARRMLLHVPSGASMSLPGSSWTWNGTSWVEVTPASGSPPGAGFAMAYHAGRGVLLFGGMISGSGDARATQIWDGTSWRILSTDGAAPVWRSNFGMAYDAARRRTVVFGGYSFAPGAINYSRLGDTWEYDGAAWTDRTPAAGGPGARVGPAMAYDAYRGRAVLFGGYTFPAETFTWEWDGTLWTSTAPASPPWRNHAAMAYDAARRRTVLFGGNSAALGTGGTIYRDTWEWNGSSWTPMTPAASYPSARSGHAMAYDPSHGVVVLFGGHDGTNALRDTWTWNGLTWLDVTPAASPPARSGHGLVYDASRGRVVLVGGTAATGASVDVWEWDGAAWTSITPGGIGPSARSGLGLVFDTDRGQTVLFGGGVDASVPALVWELDGRTSRIPAVQLDASFAAAGFGAADLQGLRVRAYACGASAAGPGAVLHGWAAQGTGAVPGWTALGANSVAPGASPPASFVGWTAASAADARRFLTGRDGGLSFQVRPVGGAGAAVAGAAVAGAAVTLDYAEARLRYTAPP